MGDNIAYLTVIFLAGGNEESMVRLKCHYVPNMIFYGNDTVLHIWGKTKQK